MRVPAPTALSALVVTLAAGGFVLVTGKAVGSAVSFGLAGGLLVLSVGGLVKMARALFTEPPAAPIVATGARRKELEREKAALLKALKELEFDHEMRKVSDADFADFGGIYRARAIRVMRQLDDTQVDYAALVEQELARRRGKPSARPVVEVAAAPIAPRCPSCSAPNDADAVFCKKCATRLVEEVAP